MRSNSWHHGGKIPFDPSIMVSEKNRSGSCAILSEIGFSRKTASVTLAIMVANVINTSPFVLFINSITLLYAKSKQIYYNKSDNLVEG